MSSRLRRVEALLQRAVAEVIVAGELRDPRIAGATDFGITGAKVSPDLSQAWLYVDVLPTGDGRQADAILQGLNAGAGAIRRQVAHRLSLKRIPALRFVRDDGVERGVGIERILAELRAETTAASEPAPLPSALGFAGDPAEDSADSGPVETGVATTELEPEPEPEPVHGLPKGS